MDSKDLNNIARKITKDPGTVRTAGKIEFVKDTGPIRRDVRIEGYQWTSDNLKNLAKILWAAQRSHSYAIAAYRLFSKMPSSGFSPDGLLGGRGYIQSIKDMRHSLASTVETMSGFTDTVHDEINAEHWKEAANGNILEIVDDAEQIKANPEQFVEEEFVGEQSVVGEKSVEGEQSVVGEQSDQESDSDNRLSEAVEDLDEDLDEPIENPSPEDYDENFVPDESDEDDEDEDEDEEDDEEFFSQFASDTFSDAKDLKKLKLRKPAEPASKLPGGSGPQDQGKSVSEMVMNTTSSNKDAYSSSISRILKAYETYYETRTASQRKPLSLEEFIDQVITAGGSSSLPVETLPGPRVEHVGPGESRTESGGYGDSFGSDDPAGEDLNSGTNMSDPLYEDWSADGVTGYDNPTDGDQTSLKISKRLAALPIHDSYSWLPGSSNDRNLNYYEIGLSDSDIDWMRQNASPPLPPGIQPPKEKFDEKSLWEVDF